MIATQPSATATAGVVFAQQPVIYIEDTYNNVRSNDTLTVTATRSAGAGTLLGTTNMAAVGGVATYTDLAHGWATNITIQFTSGALTAATSSDCAVSPGSLQPVAGAGAGPDQRAGHHDRHGRHGHRADRRDGLCGESAGGGRRVNLLTNVTDTVGITSSDATAVLPANAALVNGTNSFSVTLKDAGSQTVTATDLTTGSQTGTSSAITVNAARVCQTAVADAG